MKFITLYLLISLLLLFTAAMVALDSAKADNAKLREDAAYYEELSLKTAMDLQSLRATIAGGWPVNF